MIPARVCFSGLPSQTPINQELFSNLPVIFDSEVGSPRYRIGTILGINESGDLQLKTLSGEVEEFHQGRILRGWEIKEALDSETIQALVRRHHFETIPSTQIYARENLSLVQDAFWHVITAESQAGGIGQANRKWQSPKGNIYATFILPKSGDLTATKIQISEVVALSIVDVLKNYGIPAEIKWRNDVKVGDKKLSGVLVEVGDSEILIGIGMNVLANPSGVAAIDQETTCMEEEKGPSLPPLDVEEVFSKLERSLYVHLEVLREFGFADLLPRINAVLRYKGQQVLITSENNNVIQGVQGEIVLSGGIQILGSETEVMAGQLRPVPPCIDTVNVMTSNSQ